MCDRTNRKCPECTDKMYVDYNKYVNAIVWVCKKCKHEIFICDQ